MTLDGEITEITSPPNKADRFRGITIWVPATEEHTEITLPVEDFKKAGLAEGDQIAIKLEKNIGIVGLTHMWIHVNVMVLIHTQLFQRVIIGIFIN